MDPTTMISNLQKKRLKRRSPQTPISHGPLTPGSHRPLSAFDYAQLVCNLTHIGVGLWQTHW